MNPSEGELELLGRVMPASNATFVAAIRAGSESEGGELKVVYKPIAGERPLWDFPDGSLAFREVAAYAVSEALGWRVVPLTILRDGPHGPGMVQVWREPDPQQAAVDIVAIDDVPTGYRHVLDAVGADDEPVALVHEDSESLRRMAIFDVLINNADRKGGHVLAMPNGHRYGVDHGVAFHVDPKLRTVLWGWLGEKLSDDERTAIELVAGDVVLQERLAELLTPPEVRAFRRRCRTLLDDGVMPEPSGEWPAIPWPAF